MELSSQLIYVLGEGGVEVGVGWGRGSGWRVGSGKSLFLKGKVYGLLSISVHVCCAGDREVYE